MATILNSAILDSSILHKKSSLVHSDSTWWWQPSWNLPSWIQPFAQKKLHSCILTQIDDGSHLEFFYLGFIHFAQKKFTCSFWLNLMMAAILKSAILDSAICTKKNFTHALSLNLMMATILNSAILDSAILHKLWLKLVQSDSNSFILTELDDGSHLEFCPVGFRHCHLGFRHLVIFSHIHWKTLSLLSDSVSG